MSKQLKITDINDKLFDLIKLALPSDINPYEISMLSPKKWWTEKPYLAAVYALRKCSRINWNAYARSNPDVMAAGMDPCLHFIKHGVYEGRKLISWHLNKTVESADSPLISVIIINYNNGVYLEKCIESVINQTLKEIEIIVIDDCSTDNSLEIIGKYKKIDKRINLVVNKVNSLSMLSRKNGVDIAKGRYIIFLDSDDYLELNACEIAYSEISKGYDIVKFGMNIVNSYNHTQSEIVNCDLFCNKGDSGEYLYDEILTSIFDSRKVGWLLCGNIFLREICVIAFSELPKEKLTGPDDALAVIAIARHSRTMYKISDKLYNYNFGPGLTVNDDPRKILTYAPAMARASVALYNYAVQYSLNINAERLYIDSSTNLINRLINISCITDISSEFKQIVDILGIQTVLHILIHRYAPHKFDEIESLIKQWIPSHRDIRHIGVVLPTSSHNTMYFIKTFISELLICGYKVTCFSEVYMKDELNILPGLEIVYIYPSWSGFSTLPERVLGLRKLVLEYDIDIVFHGGIDLPCIFWDIMMLHYHDIPIIIINNFKSLIPFGRKKTDTRNWEKHSLHCADAVICSSFIDELFLRITGANSIYLSPIVNQYNFYNSKHTTNNIAFIIRDETELSEIIECLKIMKEVTNKNPYISLVMIYTTTVNKYEMEIRKNIYDYGLVNHVSLKTAGFNYSDIIKSCDLLISLSHNDISYFDLIEAQANGIPCLVYDIPIDFLNNSPGIIRVKYKNYFGISKQIISILTDYNEWNYFSMAAISAMKRYRPEIFRKELRHMLTNFPLFSPIRIYEKNNYELIIKNALFYDTH